MAERTFMKYKLQNVEKFLFTITFFLASDILNK